MSWDSSSIIPMMVSLMEISVSGVYYVIPILNYTQILMDIFSGVDLNQIPKKDISIVVIMLIIS